jgi:hypothetical protein
MDLRVGWCGLDSCDSRWELVEDTCELDNEPSDSMKYWEKLEWLKDWLILKKDLTP